MTFSILSIDGGGIRGIVPSMVLVELKRLLAQRDAADQRPAARSGHLPGAGNLPIHKLPKVEKVLRGALRPRGTRR